MHLNNWNWSKSLASLMLIWMKLMDRKSEVRVHRSSRRGWPAGRTGRARSENVQTGFRRKARNESMSKQEDEYSKSKKTASRWTQRLTQRANSDDEYENHLAKKLANLLQLTESDLQLANGSPVTDNQKLIDWSSHVHVERCKSQRILLVDVAEGCRDLLEIHWRIHWRSTSDPQENHWRSTNWFTGDSDVSEELSPAKTVSNSFAFLTTFSNFCRLLHDLASIFDHKWLITSHRNWPSVALEKLKNWANGFQLAFGEMLSSEHLSCSYWEVLTEILLTLRFSWL